MLLPWSWQSPLSAVRVLMYSRRDLGRGLSFYAPGLATAQRQLSELAAWSQWYSERFAILLPCSGQSPPSVVWGMGPNLRVGSGSGSIWFQTVAMGLTTWNTWRSWNWLVFPLKTRHFNITALPAFMSLSSDRIMTWPVCRLCRSISSWNSGSQIGDPPIFIESLSHTCQFRL